MKTKSFYTLLLLIFVVVQSMSANDKSTQTLRGTVIDKVTGFPLIGATVVLLDTDPLVGTASDLNGLFAFDAVPLGRQSVTISFMGYKPATINNLLIVSGKQTMITVELEEDVTTFAELVVKPETINKTPLNKMAMVSASSFAVEQTERFAGSLGDPARMVANYAGVSMNNDSRNDIVIRGNAPTGVLWRLEGVEIPNPNHFGALGTTGGPVSMINNNMLSNSDFFTGAFPAEYGNALAGAFDLNLRSGNAHKTEFVGQVGFNGFEAGVEGPLFTTKSGQKASYLANFRYSTLEVMHQIGFGSGTGSAVPDYKDASFIIDVPGTKLGRFKVFGLWGDSWIELGRELDDEEDTGYNERGTATDFGSGLGVIGASNTYFFNNKVKLKSTLSYQSTKSETILDSMINEQAVPWVRQDLREDKASLSSKLTYKINKRNNFNVGLIADHYIVNMVDSVYKSEYDQFLIGNDIQGDMNLLQGYFQWQHRFNNQIMAYGGLHTQYFSMNDDISVEPRLGLTYEINPKHSLNAGFGMHSQMQSKSLYFQQTYDPITDTYFTTNEDLGFTKSNHYVLNHSYNLTEQVRLKTELYYQDLYEVPIKDSFGEFSTLNGGADFGGLREDSLYNGGTGTNYGVEFTIEKFLNNGFYVLCTTSLFESKYKGADGVERNTAFNGNYVFNLLGGYEYHINEKFMLTFDLKTVLAGGKRYVPIDLTASEISRQAEYDWSRAYEDKYDPYFRTDLRIGFKQNGKKYSQEWAVDFQNLTGYNSIYREGYDADKNEVYYTYQQGFYPMFLYRINF